MIASPSDVAKERQLIRDVLAEWNAIHSQDRHVVLAPIGWETHAVPEMGDPPQKIINRQLLSDCDALVAVFWTRLGTPTESAPSGTVEEIREHVAAGKPALIYFSDEPVRLGSVDEDQYRSLMDFKKACQQNGLFETYGSISEFRDLFARNIAQTVIQKLAPAASAGTGPATSPIPRRPALNVSADAQDLLISAADTPDGIVMYLRVFGGPHVQTGARQFTEGGNARSTARWTAALEELERLGFLEDRGGKREVFYVTNDGFEAADQLRTE